MTIVAGLNPPAIIPHFGELLASFDKRLVRLRQRQERSIELGIVSRHVGDIVRPQRLGDRRHDGVGADTRAEVAQLLCQIVGRLAGNPRERAAAVGCPVEGMALSAAWGAGGRTLRCNHGPALGIGCARPGLSLRRRDTAQAKADEHRARGRGISAAAEDHACTIGPGDFRYLFLIASSAQ